MSVEVTPNLGLLKPAQEDFYNVADFNKNMEKIDEEFTEHVNDKENPHHVTAAQVGAVGGSGYAKFYRYATDLGLTDDAITMQGIMNAMEGSSYGLFSVTPSWTAEVFPSNNYGTLFVAKHQNTRCFAIFQSQESYDFHYGSISSSCVWGGWKKLADAENCLPLDGSKSMNGSINFRGSNFTNKYFEVRPQEDGNMLIGGKIRDVGKWLSLHGGVELKRFLKIIYNSTEYNIFGEHNVTNGNTDLTAGTSALASGCIHLVYE